MAYSKLTEEGEKFIRKICEGNGNNLIQGKHTYALPFTNPPVNQTWICKIIIPNTTRLMTTNQELGEALIIWFNQYAQDFQLDANVIAAQAYAESGYRAWDFPPSSTASGINQFTMLTTFTVVVENMGNTTLSNSKTTMTPLEIATITDGLKYPKSRDSYNVQSTLPQNAFYNRPILHQNMIDNPAIMIKAQCYYMKYFANNSDSLTSTSLFCYSRGTFMSPTYSRSIQKCDTNFPKNLDYKNEGLNYVLKIFGILGDKNNILEGKGLGRGYKPRGIYFGYDAEHFPTANNIVNPKNLRLEETWNPYAANVDESGQYNLQNDITENNADVVVEELSKYPQYKFIYFPEQNYFRKQTPKLQIVLHHTASGGASAGGDILWWETEVKRTGTKVAVSFIVTKDGTILQLFSTYYWAYHLGITDAWLKQYGTTGINNEQLNSQSVGIEIDNWGGLVNIGGNWHPAASPSTVIPNQDVIEYKAPDYPNGYHGFAAFERYTDAQIGSLRVLINAISKGNSKIKLGYANDLYPGAQMWGTYDNGTDKWLAERKAYAETPGIWTHVSYNPDKSDCQPQPSLVNMLKTLE